MLRVAIAPLLALVLLCGGCDRQSAGSEQAAAPGAGDAAPVRIGGLDRSHAGEAPPAVAFKGPDGGDVRLADFAGRPLLVNLWATWCAPCVAEMPTLDRLAASNARLQVVPVSQDLSGAEAVDPYWREAGFTALRPYLDTGVLLSTAYGASLPLTVLYDAQGREVWRMSGGMDWTGEAAQALLAETT